MSNSATETFGSNVFNDKTMRERLPKETYKAFRKAVDNNYPLDAQLASVIANAMKDWAVEKGATHFTHWFQPMTGVTAEKHDAFISPDGKDGAILEFSGKELIKGESDASSFPSGGLRATFEARGYTAWDPTSYAFIKDNTLCIPTAFCSFGGEALDKKTPLLRSMDAISNQAMRILRLFGNTDTDKVITTVGAEQEYFLIDADAYYKRRDLVNCGRTLFGARPSKGQELDDHYYGSIKPRVMKFMSELDEELWKLGIYAKTEHNEVAPAQHELAPVFSTTNIATDQNQLTMEMMKRVAANNGLVCLLHEKPFACINGSGKHNNWSLSTDKGVNLLEPGDTPEENAQFLLFLLAVVKAVDEYQDLLRISVASAGNDNRLGANEAPPAIISVFLGDEIEDILNSIETGALYGKRKKQVVEIGVTVLPKITKDTTDRNRTSPFAFTGNKFEFRMPGSNFSIAEANTVINTIVANSLSDFADELENSVDFMSALKNLIKRTITEHKRIIFNGNNYSDEWLKEAGKRGLLNLKTTPLALKHYLLEKNVALFTKFKIYTPAELTSRHEILLENYCKVINIEVQTATAMLYRDILPSVFDYMNVLSELIKNKIAIGVGATYKAEEKLLKRISVLTDSVCDKADEFAILTANVNKSEEELADYYAGTVLPALQEIRSLVDELETLIPTASLPYPTYYELINSVR